MIESGHDDRTETSAGPEPLAAVSVAAAEAGRGDLAALDRLVDALVGLERGGDADLGRAALGVLAGSPALVLRLDARARRAFAYSTVPADLEWLAARLRVGSVGPIGAALVSTHPDGRVRELAVEAMLDRPLPQLMPFLVLRTGDWVRQLRDRARAGLALLLADDPGGYLPAALPTTLLARSRLRGSFAYAQALATLITAPAGLRERLLTVGDRDVRRFVFDTAVALGWLGLRDLVTVAESDDDVRNRIRAAEAACRAAVWTRNSTVLHRLAGGRRANVRVVALTGLVRVGEDPAVLPFLDDDSALVRSVARDAARRVGVDALGHYRAAVAAPTPAGGAIAGLAETGSAADAALLRPLLAHAAAAVRFRAVRALRQLDAVEVDELVPLLRDPAPAVVRETTAALRPLPRRVSSELAWQLLADPRVELRRAGYRLLRDRSIADRLRAALLIAVDPDPGLAGRGRTEVTALVRERSRPWRRRPAAPELVATGAELADLTGLADRAAPALGEDIAALLADWLAGATPLDRAGAPGPYGQEAAP